MYISTRNKLDSYTAYRALHEERTPDGGQFVPFRMPCFSREEIAALHEKSFSQIVADILNLFFSARLSAWDVEAAIGRNPVRITEMSHRLIVAECWHNPQGNYATLEKHLYDRLCQGAGENKTTQWARIAIYIALLFATCRDPEQIPVDIAVNTEDFVLPMAAFYARQMGLPVGKIICACNENGAVWDLIHRGEFNTGVSAVKTALPALDIPHPAGIERLVYATLGLDGVLNYCRICEKRATWRLTEEELPALSSGLFASVVGTERTQAIINSVYRTNQYLIDPYTALSYGGLQDYRSRTGESRRTLLLAHFDPIQFADVIGPAIGISASELRVRSGKSKE